MNRQLRKRVWERAKGRCEYCRLPHRQEPLFPFHIEHVIPRKHHGTTTLDNLALACYFCNLHKSSNLVGIDPESGEPAWLFHPRREQWRVHFRWRRAILVGRTAIGRATIDVLGINHPDRVRLREALRKTGDWSP